MNDMFAVSAEQEAEWAESNKTRHARLPAAVFEKPVFDREAMPKSAVPEVTKARLTNLEHKIKFM